MEFGDLTQPFTQEQKMQSFLYLQSFLLDKIEKNETFFVGRMGGNEPNLCGKMLSGQELPINLMNEMLFAAGIQFLTKEDIKQFVKLHNNACKNSSLLGVWAGGTYLQAKPYYDLLDKMYPDQKRICAQALEPFYYMNNDNYKFNNIYKNKRVLIITSHKETTIQQFKKQRDIFDKPIFDKTTEIDVYKPVQQYCGNHDKQSWTAHLNKMQVDLKNLYNKNNYDIALVSCGGFGMILSDYIYSKLNKSVMYVGGSLQLYFGIIGSRWLQHPVISKFINNKWTHVLECDKPTTLLSNPNMCENGCYW